MEQATLTAPTTRPVKAARARRWSVMLVVIIVLGAGVLRVLASRNGFWVDEIFSLDIARSSRSLAQAALTPSDNNHPLNTIWLYLVGERRHWEVYRIPAMLSGTLAVALIAMLLRCEGKAASVIGAVLAGTSYFLVHYGSEARGYAPAMLFALLCMLILRRYFESPRRTLSLGFVACVALGVLSHPSFVYIYLGLLAWSLAEFRRTKEMWIHLVRLHAVPLAFLGVVYLLLICRLTPGGGAPYPAWRAAVDAIAWTMGWARNGWMTIAMCAATALIVVNEIAKLYRKGDSEWIFYAVALLIGPAAALMVWREPFVYPRYFAVGIPLILILISRFLARAWSADWLARIGCCVFMALFVWGNERELSRFFKLGRGQYLQAMRYMSANGRTTVGALQDQRNPMVFRFYESYRSPQERLEYVRQEDWPSNPPQWIVVDGLEWSDPVATERIRKRGYKLDRIYRYYGLSGFEWWLYRRE